ECAVNRRVVCPGDCRSVRVGVLDRRAPAEARAYVDGECCNLAAVSWTGDHCDQEREDQQARTLRKNREIDHFVFTARVWRRTTDHLLASWITELGVAQAAHRKPNCWGKAPDQFRQLPSSTARHWQNWTMPEK